MTISKNTIKGKQIPAIIKAMTNEQFEVLRSSLSNRKFVPETTLTVIKYIREGKSTNKITEIMNWKSTKQFNWITNKIANNYKEHFYQF